MWEKSICRCGFGEEHFKYERPDHAAVTRNHGIDGDGLYEGWLAFGFCVGQMAKNPFKTSESAIKYVDKHWPSNSDV